MCIFPAPPAASQAPAPPSAPKPPPPLPQAQDPKVVSARRKTKQQAALATGRSATILTSGLGLTTPATSAKKSILGR